MSSVKISEEQKLQLRKEAKAELARLQNVMANHDTAEMVNSFKNKFTQCEITYKVVLKRYQSKKNAKKKQSSSYLKIDMKQVPYALKFAGYDFDKELLSKLFGSESRIGVRSVKKLRDSLTHSMNQKAIDELGQRSAELNGYMDAFLCEINNHDKEHAKVL